MTEPLGPLEALRRAMHGGAAASEYRWLRSPIVWVGTALLTGVALWLSGFAERTIESIPVLIWGPLEVTATTNYGQIQADFLGAPQYVVPLPPDRIDTPPGWDEGLEARQRWVEEHGGVDGGETWVQIDIRGRTSRPVLLTDLRVNMIERLPPVRGTIVSYGEFGDAILERIVQYSLTDDPPRIIHSVDNRWMHGAIAKSEADPIDFPYRVSSSEPELFYVVGNAHHYVPQSEIDEGCECVWTLELAYSDGAETGTITIYDNDGEPFRTTTTVEGAPYAVSYIGEPLSVITSGDTEGE